jgi:hypothetical protein
MSSRKRYTQEFKREAVVMTKAAGVTARQVARDEETAAHKRELSRVKKERDFFKRNGGALRERIAIRYRMIERCVSAFPVRPGKDE